MGQKRTDSHEQIAAKRRGAERRRCPDCGRGNALSRIDTDYQRGRECRYCGYAKWYDLDTAQWFEKHVTDLGEYGRTSRVEFAALAAVSVGLREERQA